MPEISTNLPIKMSTTTTVRSPTGNPLKYDPELMRKMTSLQSIQTHRQFRRWKASFLRRFEGLLGDKGIQPAKDSYGAYTETMEAYEQQLNQVRELIEQGSLTIEKTTVKGRRKLNELVQTMNKVIEKTESLIPATNQDEEKMGYNKYHLGAILVEDGFMEYDRMARCNDKKKHMLNELGLKEVADRQQMAAMDRYEVQVQRFVDVMHDLGLYDLMIKCREFMGGSIDEIVLIHPKTGAIIELPRQVLFQAGILHEVEATSETSSIREAINDPVARAEIAVSIREALGIAMVRS